MVAQPVEVAQLVHVSFKSFYGHRFGWSDQKDLSGSCIRFQLVCCLVKILIGRFQAFDKSRVFAIDPAGQLGGFDRSAESQIPRSDNNDFLLPVFFCPGIRDFFCAPSIEEGDTVNHDGCSYIRNGRRGLNGLVDIAFSLLKIFHFSIFQVGGGYDKLPLRIIQPLFIDGQIF